MKRYTIQLLLLGLLTNIFFVSCKKDERDINMNFVEVKNLFTPVNNSYIKLEPAANMSTTFEWEEAKAEDGSLVLYEVAFDQENGDFSNPFYVVESDNKGIQNRLTLTHGDLNRIAKLGGAEFFQRKKFKWTVLASKGTVVKKAAASAILDLERPGGFDVLPANMYITGSATEGGASISNALKMKQLSPGVFEIYTKLKPGSYKFVDNIQGTPKEYFLREENNLNVISVNGQSNFTGSEKVMRIRLDFNNVNGSLAEVKEVALWYCAGNSFWFTLPYAENGVWRKSGHVVNYTAMPWGFEDRYKYRMVINDGTGDKNVWLNYERNDSPGQDGQWPHTLQYKTINFNANNGSQWDWSWKFDKNYLTQGSVADFWVSLRATEPAYTQGYQKQ